MAGGRARARISSPQPTLAYDVPARGAAEIPLSAVADADARRLFWFVDDALVGVADAGETLFWRARQGTHVVRVVDENGRADEHSLTVASGLGPTDDATCAPRGSGGRGRA